MSKFAEQNKSSTAEEFQFQSPHTLRMK